MAGYFGKCYAHTRIQTITLISEPDEDCYLANWLVTEGSVTVENNQFTMPKSNVIVSAVFEQVGYSISVSDSMENGREYLRRQAALCCPAIFLTT